VCVAVLVIGEHDRVLILVLLLLFIVAVVVAMFDVVLLLQNCEMQELENFLKMHIQFV